MGIITKIFPANAHVELVELQYPAEFVALCGLYQVSPKALVQAFVADLSLSYEEGAGNLIRPHYSFGWFEAFLDDPQGAMFFSEEQDEAA